MRQLRPLHAPAVEQIEIVVEEAWLSEVFRVGQVRRPAPLVAEFMLNVGKVWIPDRVLDFVDDGDRNDASVPPNIPNPISTPVSTIIDSIAESIIVDTSAASAR